MEITNTIPSYNPADTNTLDGLNNFLQDKIFFNLEKVLPGIVESYDRATNRATIKPAITGIASQGQKVSKNPLVNIPVFCLSGGGITMSFPLKKGDKGWLVANDRNISIFKQNLEESAPNDFRKHKFEDAVFFPDKINNIAISEADTDAFVIQNADGTKKIALSDSGIDLTGDTAITGYLTVSTGATGTFVSQDNKTITVKDGIITGIS